MQRRGFNYERIDKSADGLPQLDGITFAEASPTARKLSDAVKTRWTRWLTAK